MNEDHPRNVYGSSQATIAKESAAATVQLEQMTREFHDRPENKLARDKESLERLRSTEHWQNRQLTSQTARNEEAMLVAKIRDQETALETAAKSGTAGPQLDPAAESRVSYGQQIPTDDFKAAVSELVAHGVRPSLVESFLTHGHGDSDLGGPPEDRQFEMDRAAEWLRNLMNDPEKQRRLLAKEPEIMRQFAAYGMYAADARRS